MSSIRPPLSSSVSELDTLGTRMTSGAACAAAERSSACHGVVDAVNPDKALGGAEPPRLDGIDNLLARGLFGVGRNRILKVEDHPVDRQRLRLVQRPRIRSWHVQHAAPRADSHCGLQLSSAWSLASAMRMRHCCNGLPEPVMACFV